MPANDTLFAARGKVHRGACAKVFVRCAGNPRANGYSLRIYKESK
ncbi:protein-tyrosine-phosphatase, partial [Klebsiella pneumoniae]|nr:protein-tyrosine-phosphatase [Klebsiella pneumoniae]